MFNIHFITHQIVVSNTNPPIIIFPINNAGDLEFFLGDSNSMRSLKEIKLLFDKRSYTKTNHIESIRLDKLQFITKRPEETEFNNILVGAFSEGYNRLRFLFNTTSKEFQDYWKQIWDVDCAVKGYGGWDDYLQCLKTWFENDSDKKSFRLIHSDYTAGNELINLISNYFHNSKKCKLTQVILKRIRQLFL